MKNLCKVCRIQVTDKTGQRCEGLCRKWIHYDCLNFSPDKIDAIRKGIIKINCPCPNCEGNKKDHHSTQKKCGSISGYCGKSKCPGMPKVDSELKYSSSPPPERAHMPCKDTETKVSKKSLISTPLGDAAVSTHSLDSKTTVKSRALSPIRKHRPTSPIRAHMSTCMSAQYFQDTIVHKSTSVQLFPCNKSCTDICSESNTSDVDADESDTEINQTSEDKSSADKHARRDEPLEESRDVTCPYCLSRIVLGGLPGRLYHSLQNQEHNNNVVECSNSADDVSPCFEYSKNKSTKKPTLTQQIIDQCTRKGKRKSNAVQNVSSVASMQTNTSYSLKRSNTVDTSTSTNSSSNCYTKSHQNTRTARVCGADSVDRNNRSLSRELSPHHQVFGKHKSEDESYDSITKQNALGSVLNQISNNMEDMRQQFKYLLKYFRCPKCST